MIHVVHQRGNAADLHGLEPFGDDVGADDPHPRVWYCDLTQPAIVLGSRQRDDVLDLAACRRRGWQLVRRRSGGAAVLLVPDSIVWIDVVLPHGFAPDDVRGSMVWIGERWVTALRAEGSVADTDADLDDLQVHVGGMVRSAWSELVCFAGLGPGEVLHGGRKLVGLSQRRTRHGIRVQGLVHRTPLMRHTVSVLRPPLPDGAPPDPAVLEHLDVDRLASALADALDASV